MLTNANMYLNPYGKRQLSPFFEPGPYDVVCARGKAAFEHEGNKRFRELVKIHQEAYANAPTKYHKSQIVSHITNTVREASPYGGFVKLIKGIYYEVGDRAAKEKIGQTFRDLLHTKYTSSTKAKAQARIQKRIEEYERSESGSDNESDNDDAVVPKKLKEQEQPPQEGKRRNQLENKKEEEEDQHVGITTGKGGGGSCSFSIVSNDTTVDRQQNSKTVPAAAATSPARSTTPPHDKLLDPASQILEFPSPSSSTATPPLVVDLEPLPFEPLPLKDIFLTSNTSFDDDLKDFLTGEFSI